jgi:hypothetical protein
MPPAPNRFEFARPTTQSTRAIVIRGRGRFAIVRPDSAPSSIIPRAAAENLDELPRLRLGGVPLDDNAGSDFEAGMQFGRAI